MSSNRAVFSLPVDLHRGRILGLAIDNYEPVLREQIASLKPGSPDYGNAVARLDLLWSMRHVLADGMGLLREHYRQSEQRLLEGYGVVS